MMTLKKLKGNDCFSLKNLNFKIKHHQNIRKKSFFNITLLNTNKKRNLNISKFKIINFHICK